MVLTWLDYLVIAGYLLAITAFGSWFARFQKTTRDYFLTGRSVPWWAICFTIVATETSTLTLHRRAGECVRRQHDLSAARRRLHGRPRAREHALHPGVLPRRAVHVVRAAAAALRAVGQERGRRSSSSSRASLADGIRLFATALVISVVTHVPVSLDRGHARRRDDRLHRPRRGRRP